MMMPLTIAKHIEGFSGSAGRDSPWLGRASFRRPGSAARVNDCHYHLRSAAIKTPRLSSIPRENSACACGGEKGFTLAELMVAMAVFVVVFATAMVLFVQQQKVFSQQKGQVALNIGLRSAVTQLQMDLANAATGFFVGANIPAWPVGVTIFNSAPGGGCYNAVTKTYSSTCFDTLNVLAVDPNTPPIHADNPGNAGCTNVNSAVSNGDPAVGYTLAQTAAFYHTGDQLLFLEDDGSQMSTVILTADGSTLGNGTVKLQHNPTAADGSNSTANDPLGFTTHAGNKLGAQFCTSDWILKLAPITYSVDASNPANPKLNRSQGGTTSMVMEQIIGFKVGAAIWNNSTDTLATQYNYDASTYTNTVANDQAFNYTLVRSIRISLIGRTTPTVDPSYKFRNTFDGGAYQIQGAAVVVNPRNLSMND
jgi:prepilin-type N-terminal cleavage/methylation domain-containing protein